jgi:hypothetical protein
MAVSFIGGGNRRTQRKPPTCFQILFVCLLVFNATFNNILVISWRSVLLVEETGRPGENLRPAASQLINNVIG